MTSSPQGCAPVSWRPASDLHFVDILYDKAEGVARITINRPERHNAFRPETLNEMMTALHLARLDPEIGVVVLTGAGDKAFCSGGDQKIRGEDGGYRDSHGVNHLNALDLQRMIRTLPKPVVAMVAGWAIGGGHVLHLVCDLTIAAENARFGQTGPKVGSFDAGFGAGLMSRAVGLKKAKEIWFLCRQYDAKEEGFVPGGSSLHNCMSGHGPDAATVEKAERADTRIPEHVDGTMAFMFETRAVICPTATALALPQLQPDYPGCWATLPKRFTAPPGRTP